MTSPPSLSRQRPSTVVWTETELWVQQFQTQRQLLQAARQVLDELKQATAMTTSTPMMYPEAGLTHPMELFEEDMIRRRHVQLTCETRLVQLYRTLQQPISPTTTNDNNNNNNKNNNNKDDLHSNENENEDTAFPNSIIRTMQRNYPTPDMVRFAKDVRENERKLFHTISRDFAAAHQRSQAALHIMQGQGQGHVGHGREGTTGPISIPPNENYQGYFHQFASSVAANPPYQSSSSSSSSYHYQPYGTNSIIKQQYVRLHEMPFYAYGDALERVRKLQDDLEDEIVALELILLYGGGSAGTGSGGGSSPTNNRQQQQQQQDRETEMEEGEIFEEMAVAATTDTSTDSPPYLTEPTSMEADHHNTILQQLTPHRSLLPTAAPTSTSSSRTLSNQNRNLAAERSPLRKAVGIISFPNDEDEDDGEKKHPPIMDTKTTMTTTTITTTTTSSSTDYPTQDLKSKPVSTPPKIDKTENTAETTAAANDDDTTSTPKGTPSSTDGGEWKTVVVMRGKKGGPHHHDLTPSSSTLEPLEAALGENQQHQQPQNKKKEQGRDLGPWDASTSSSESA
ncbi:hypothetical protein IV203_028460 [Nitzschia inconspicua]|uniref:Uncharacterized protein n=1 Tax=Nitzschia inconspicua TaxID=303405 RepID=A0A9K3LPN3_9STRA|nr:hypothetical protein IV203_028460 [Nitzschia inconspicua]